MISAWLGGAAIAGVSACFLSSYQYMCQMEGRRRELGRGKAKGACEKQGEAELLHVRGASYFLSGVMGGSGAGTASLAGVAVESQDYRASIRAAVLAADSTACVVDPAEVVELRAPELHADGMPEAGFWKEDGVVREMLDEVVALAAQCDVVISYLPTASMGSAVELHAAREAGRLVVVVAPNERMRANWVVRAYAHFVFDDIASLGRWLIAEQRRV
jgi:hypothetical protein